MAKVLGAVVCGLLIGLFVLLFSPRTSHLSSALSAPKEIAPSIALTATGAPEVAPPPAKEVQGERADAAFVRGGPRSALTGGLLNILSSFSSADGAYDLVVHVHGDPFFVIDAFAYAGLNAVVATVNIGAGSNLYEELFAMPWALPQIIEQTQSAMEKRGLRGAKLRRVAVSAFSAGFVAVRRILELPAVADKVDAVLLLDGLHVGYSPRDPKSLDLERLAGFERFAREASLGKKLFVITHSEITPKGEYASTTQTTDKLLSRLGLSRTPGGEATEIPDVPCLRGRPMQKLVPRSRVDKGELHVRGYAGDQTEDHMMHLLQISAIAIPDLIRYWSRGAAH